MQPQMHHHTGQCGVVSSENHSFELFDSARVVLDDPCAAAAECSRVAPHRSHSRGLTHIGFRQLKNPTADARIGRRPDE